MKMNRVFLAVAAGVVLAAGCVKEQAGMEPAGNEAGIVADAPMIIAEQSEPLTRTCIDAAADATGTLPVLWEASDEVGVFFEGGTSNAKYVNASGQVPNASFGAAAAVNGTTIKYVYYPYDAANDGKEATALSGTVPAEQAMDGSIHGDYKWGELKTQVEEGYKFTFHNLFSLVRFNINAEGTVLAGETLESVTLTVTRNGEAVPVAGDFTFSAADGSYALGTTSNVLKTTWNQALSGTLSNFASVFPEIKSGDQMTFVLETTNYKATLTVTSKANFAPETYYTFPLTLSKLSGLTIVKKVSGTFKAATYNVQSSTSGAIGTLVTADGWDFFGLSEDFQNVSSNFSSYTFGTRSVGTLSMSSPKDGLGFATRNAKCSFANEYIDEFDEEYGGLLDGANTNVDKGFRHYIVTIDKIVEVDVIITHMNTYDTEEHWNCQHAQLQEIANWIANNCGSRPVIFMGDTNLRYTRHDFETYFWSIIRKAGGVYSDPWVEYQWDGIYPTYPSNSLMVSDQYKSTNTSNDINTESTQKGEVVDKIIYINYPEIDTQISANNYLRDMDYTEEKKSWLGTTSIENISDHMPIVVDFTYTTTTAIN